MRTACRILIVLLALIMLAGIFAVQSAQRALRDSGVENLDWRGVSWADWQLSVDEITGRYASDQGNLGFAAWGVQVKLVWQAGPRLELVDIRDLDLDWRPTPGMTVEDPMLDPDPGSPTPASVGESRRPLDPRDWLHVPHWFPTEAAIRDLRLNMPCQQKRCELTGAFNAQRSLSADSLAAQLSLLTGAESLKLTVDLRDDAGDLGLTGNLALSGQPALQLQSSWRGAADTTDWQGSLSMPGWPDANWLFGFVEPWLKPGTLPINELPSELHFDMNWELQPGQTPIEVADLLAGAVQVNGRLGIPQPWKIKNVGAVSGDVDIQLEGDQGSWLLHQGAARMRLEQLSLPALANIPVKLRPVGLDVTIEPETGSTEGWRAALPLTVRMTLEGPLAGSLDTKLHVSNVPALRAELQQGRLRLAGRHIAYAGAQLQNLRADLPFGALINQQRLSVVLGESAELTAAAVELSEAGVKLNDARLDMAGLEFGLPFTDDGKMTLDAPLRLGVVRLEHSLLRSQSWSLAGKLDYGPAGLDWQGAVAAASGLELGLALTWPPNAGWRARLTPGDIFLRAANPLALTFADWPALLDLSAGRLTGNFDASGNPALERIQGRLDLSGVRGIYDRAEFGGLNLPLMVNFQSDQLTLETSDTTLETIDPGLPVGPVSFAGRYRASLAQVMAGNLEIKQATSGLLGGRLVLQPGVLDFAQPRQDLMVGLQGLELAKLFEAYPADGLSGHGTIDGQLPVTLTDNGILIDNGLLRAREPGGVLQYRSDKLAGLGSNPAMRELVLALDDFRYSVLASDLDYDEDGMLILGLRLEGHNPELQRGRPVHLNVRLEEDIPALLASLQLSGQVSDIIQKRVQERLLQQR